MNKKSKPAIAGRNHVARASATLNRPKVIRDKRDAIRVRAIEREARSPARDSTGGLLFRGDLARQWSLEKRALRETVQRLLIILAGICVWAAIGSIGGEDGWPRDTGEVSGRE